MWRSVEGIHSQRSVRSSAESNGRRPSTRYRVLAFMVVPFLWTQIFHVAAAQGAPQSEDERLKIQMKALTSILDAADRLCASPPIESHDQHVELTGDAKAKLDGIVAKVADLGISGAAKYQSDKSKGVLREKLAEALKNSNDCKLTVLVTLKSLIPGLNSEPGPGSPPAR